MGLTEIDLFTLKRAKRSITVNNAALKLDPCVGHSLRLGLGDPCGSLPAQDIWGLCESLVRCKTITSCSQIHEPPQNWLN